MATNSAAVGDVLFPSLRESVKYLDGATTPAVDVCCCEPIGLDVSRSPAGIVYYS